MDASPVVLMLLASREASETFIAREIDALQKRGYPLLVASLTDLPHALHMEGEAPTSHTPNTWRARLRRAARLANLSARQSLALQCRIFEELLSFSPLNALRIWRHRHKISALVTLARKTNATRLHAQFAWIAADVTGIAASILKIPWACSVHAWDVFTRPAPELRRRLRGAEFIIACNQRAHDAVASAVTCHVHLIRHGVKWREHLAPKPTREQDAPATILAIGRLVPKKGFDTLLVALSQTRHKHARLTLIGDGPERGNLLHLATKLNLTSRVTFLWQLPHDATLQALSRATLLALPSRRTRDNDSDGFANVLAEAMQFHVPIITTSAAGATELLTHNDSALIIPPDDPAQLASAIDRLLSEPALQTRLATNARRVLETQLNEDLEIEKTAALLFPQP